MHDGAEVVVAEVDAVGTVRFEVSLLVLHDVVPENLDEVVPVATGLFVPDADGVGKFVYDAPASAGGGEPDTLLFALVTDGGAAVLLCSLELYVSRFSAARYEADVRVLLHMFDGPVDPVTHGLRGVAPGVLDDGVGHDSVPPGVGTADHHTEELNAAGGGGTGGRQRGELLRCAENDIPFSDRQAIDDLVGDRRNRALGELPHHRALRSCRLQRSDLDLGWIAAPVGTVARDRTPGDLDTRQSEDRWRSAVEEVPEYEDGVTDLQAELSVGVE